MTGDEVIALAEATNALNDRPLSDAERAALVAAVAADGDEVDEAVEYVSEFSAYDLPDFVYFYDNGAYGEAFVFERASGSLWRSDDYSTVMVAKVEL